MRKLLLGALLIIGFASPGVYADVVSFSEGSVGVTIESSNTAGLIISGEIIDSFRDDFAFGTGLASANAVGQIFGNASNLTTGDGMLIEANVSAETSLPDGTADGFALALGSLSVENTTGADILLSLSVDYRAFASADSDEASPSIGESEVTFDFSRDGVIVLSRVFTRDSSLNPGFDLDADVVTLEETIQSGQLVIYDLYADGFASAVSVVAVPEPAYGAVLLGCAFGGLTIRRQRRVV